MLRILTIIFFTAVTFYTAASRPASIPVTTRVGRREEQGLHNAAVSRGKYFGTATGRQKFSADVKYYQQVNNTRDFGQLVPENDMKWGAIQPQRGVFNFAGGDAVANLAAANGQLLRCHALLWHIALPGWVTSGNFNNATLISIMKDHIKKTVTHYKGKCYAWDVVNEALHVNGTYRTNVFYDTIGPAYIPIAFAAAAEADPQAKLYYNDFGIEFPGPKATGAIKIVKLVKQYGVKIDGVGLQGHYDLSGMPPEAHFELGSMPSYDEQVAVMKSYTALGVEVAITELDVSILTPGNTAKYEKQAEVYYNATAACLTINKCIGITVWDWTDKYTWVPSVFPDLGEALPWDKILAKKPAYYGILKAFNNFKP